MTGGEKALRCADQLLWCCLWSMKKQITTPVRLGSFSFKLAGTSVFKKIIQLRVQKSNFYALSVRVDNPSLCIESEPI